MIALAALGLGACSLIADSSLNNLGCDNNACEVGYSCRHDQCVKDHSLGETDGTCTKSIQCKEPLQCSTVSHVCSKACSAIYQVSSECDADHVCSPVPDADPANAGKYTGGACVPTQCKTNDDCKAEHPNTKCVKLAKNGGLCLGGCKVDVRKVDSPGNVGTDACSALDGNVPAHCGLLGSDYVCLPAGGAKEGDACTLFPLSGSKGLDACSTNVPLPGSPGLPLVCMGGDGTSNGDQRCRLAHCAQGASQNGCTPAAPFCTGEVTARELDSNVTYNFCAAAR